MKHNTLLICFLIAFGSASATVARQQLRSDMSYSENNRREGRYKYGYAVKDGETQFHHQRSLDGAVYGCYGFVDPQGKLFITHYLADMAGYRLVNMANPDKKLLDRIQSLGSADHPIELQSFFPLECQADGDIKVLQETAAQTRSSQSVAQDSIPNRQNSLNHPFSDASTVHSGKTNHISSDHVSVKTLDSAASEVSQKKLFLRKFETSPEKTIVQDVEQATAKTSDSTVQLSRIGETSDGSMDDTANQRKDSIDSSKIAAFRRHATKGNRIRSDLRRSDEPGFIRVKVLYDTVERSPALRNAVIKTATESSILGSENVAVAEESLATESPLQAERHFSSESTGVISSTNTDTHDESSNESLENAAEGTESQLSSDSMGIVSSKNNENVQLSRLKDTINDEKSTILKSGKVPVVRGSLLPRSSLQADRSKIKHHSSVVRNKVTEDLKSHSIEQRTKHYDESINFPVQATGDSQKSNSMFRGRVKYKDYAASPPQPAEFQRTKTNYPYNSGQYKADNSGSFKSSSKEQSSRGSSGQTPIKTSTGAGIRGGQGVSSKSGSSYDIGGAQSFFKSSTDMRQSDHNPGNLKGSIRRPSVSTKTGANTIEGVPRAGSSVPAMNDPDQHFRNVQEPVRKSPELFKLGTNAGSSGNMVPLNTYLSNESTLKSSSDDTGIGGQRLINIRLPENVKSSEIDDSAEVLGDIEKSINKSSESFESGLDIIQNNYDDVSSSQFALKSSTMQADLAVAAIQVQNVDGDLISDHDGENVPASSKNSASPENIEGTADGSLKSINSDSSSQSTLKSSTGDSETDVSGSFEGSSDLNNDKIPNKLALDSPTVEVESDTAAVQVQDDGTMIKAGDSSLNSESVAKIDDSAQVSEAIEKSLNKSSESFESGLDIIQNDHEDVSSSQFALKSSTMHADSAEAAMQVQDVNVDVITDHDGENVPVPSKNSASPENITEDSETDDKQLMVFHVSDSFEDSSDLNNGEISSKLALDSPTVEVESDTAAIQVQDDGIEASISSLNSEGVAANIESVIQGADPGVSSSKDRNFIIRSTVPSNQDYSSAGQWTTEIPSFETDHGTLLKDNNGSFQSSLESVKQSSHTMQNPVIDGRLRPPILPIVDNAKAGDSDHYSEHTRISPNEELDGRLNHSPLNPTSVETVPALRQISAIRVSEYVEQRNKNAARSKVPEKSSQEYPFSTHSTLTRTHPVESKISSVSNYESPLKHDDSAVLEDADEGSQRLMIPKLPATPRPIPAGHSNPVTQAYSISSHTNKPPVHPHPTTGYRPSISNIYYQGAKTTTTVKPESPARTTIGPSGDVYDEIEEDPEPVSASRPTQMSPQIPSTSSSGSSGISIQSSISSNCYEVVLQIPADAKQVLLKTESSSFRVYGDGDPYNRVKLVQPGIYEVNVGAIGAIKFQQYQNNPQKDANKLQLNLGKGFNYDDLVPTPANREAVDSGDATLNNPYLPQVTIEKARSVGSTEVVTVGEESHELTAEQRAILDLIPSWQKVIQHLKEMQPADTRRI